MLSRDNFATMLFAVCNVAYSAGKNYFIIDNTDNYIINNTPPEQPYGSAETIRNVVITIGLLAAMGINLYINIPAFRRAVRPTTTQPLIIPAIESAPLYLAGKITNTTLNAAGWGYGIMVGMLAYSLTKQLCQLTANVPHKESGNAAWREVLTECASIFVLIGLMAKYAIYDRKVIKGNARLIAEGVDARHFPLNKAMGTTLALSAFNLVTHPMQSYFFAKPALTSMPLVRQSETLVDALTAVACTTTFLAVVSWLPSLYVIFSKRSTATDEPQRHLPSDAPACTLTAINSTGYAIGGIDSIIQGCGSFMGVIAVLEGLFHANPYAGWVIAFATLSAINGAAVNAGFSVAPGLKATMRELSQRRLITEQTSPLLTDAMRAGMTSFALEEGERVEIDVGAMRGKVLQSP